MNAVVLYTPGPDVLERAPLHFAAHSARCDEFHAAGTLLMVGTFADPVTQGSMVAFAGLGALAPTRDIDLLALPGAEAPHVAEARQGLHASASAVSASAARRTRPRGPVASKWPRRASRRMRAA